MKIVLASESEFRRHALDMLGVIYEVCPKESRKKESTIPILRSLTQKLAEEKAANVAEHYCNNRQLSCLATLSPRKTASSLKSHATTPKRGCAALDVLWMFESPSMAQFPFTAPPGWGLPLTGVYLLWARVLVAPYPLCALFARLKQRRADVWLSYV